VASGVGDRPAEPFQGEVGRLRAAAPAGVETIDRRQILVGQLEVEDVEVLRDAVRFGRLEQCLERPIGLQGPVEGRGQRLVQDQQVDPVDAELGGALLVSVQGWRYPADSAARRAARVSSGGVWNTPSPKAGISTWLSRVTCVMSRP